MGKISPLMIAPPLVFAGFVALAAFGMFRADPEGLPSTLVGQMAPALPEKPLEGFPAAAPDVLPKGCRSSGSISRTLLVPRPVT